MNCIIFEINEIFVNLFVIFIAISVRTTGVHRNRSPALTSISVFIKRGLEFITHYNKSFIKCPAKPTALFRSSQLLSGSCH